MTFETLFSSFNWHPIRDCPGRFVLRDISPELTTSELVGSEVIIERFASSSARDRVAVARLDIGGTISYERADGTYLHTLNTDDGLVRKLKQLGIAGLWR